MAPPRVEDVEELCRLALVARRLGCRVRLLDVDPTLRDTLALAGVEYLLLVDAPPTSPESGNRPLPGLADGDLR